MNKTKIELKDLAFFAHHGVLKEEAELGQRFKVDVTLRLIDGLKFAADSPDCTVNYVDVYEAVKETFLGKRFNLIESAAEAVAAVILERFRKVVEVSVIVKKPAVPVDCICEYFSAEVTRCR
ncbi:dihydroneopterin aldolase [Coraliomargarita sinensis]|nr:dihydroneopterin aldolase [Coraliomargarita sinensis]